MATQQPPANPFLTLAVSFVAQVCAGTHYWFPAIAPGIAAALVLSEWQTTVLIAWANSGAILGIIGGLLHQRYGSRLTASFAALGVALSYSIIGFITMTYNGSPAPPFVYYLTLVLTVCVTTASFPLYACSISATASIFPQRYRGRLVGLIVMTYGGSSGVLTAIQAVVFPTTADAAANLFFVAAYSVAVAVATYIVFPRAAKYDVEHISIPDHELLPLRHSTALIHSETSYGDSPVPGYDNYISPLLSFAYRIALFLVVALQLNAVCGIVNASFHYQLLAAVLVVGSLFTIFLLPTFSTLRVYPVSEGTCTSEQDVEGMTSEEKQKNTAEHPSLWTVLADVRSLYVAAAFAILVGGSGLFLLVQSLYLVDSLQYGASAVWTDMDAHMVVRTIVALFGACSVTGRLIMGGIIDRGNSTEERIVYAFRLLRYDMLAMMVALLVLTVPSKLAMLGAIIGIGLAYGAFFCITPTLLTLWFGVATFPRNYAVYAACTVFATVSVNSSVAEWIRHHTGHWINVGSEEMPRMVCGGVMCFLPTVLPSTALLLGMFVGGKLLQPVVDERARAKVIDGVGAQPQR